MLLGDGWQKDATGMQVKSDEILGHLWHITEHRKHCYGNYLQQWKS